MRSLITLCFIATPLLVVLLVARPVDPVPVRAETNDSERMTLAGGAAKRTSNPEWQFALNARSTPRRQARLEAPSTLLWETCDEREVLRAVALLKTAPMTQRGVIFDSYDDAVENHIAFLQRETPNDAAAVQEALDRRPVYRIDRHTLEPVLVTLLR